MKSLVNQTTTSYIDEDTAVVDPPSYFYSMEDDIMLVIDEVHIYNKDTTMWKILRKIPCRCRLGVTGTQAQSYAHQFFDMHDLLLPVPNSNENIGILGLDAKDFKRFGIDPLLDNDPAKKKLRCKIFAPIFVQIFYGDKVQRPF